MSDSSGRMPLIDALKAAASQLIVLHHFAAYGPLAAAARQLAPLPVAWFYDYARMAVQVFLVCAGFLVARSLSPTGQALAVAPLPLIGRRYLRLVVPYLTAIALAVLCAALARPWLADEMIPAPPSPAQLLAHALLVQSLLDFDSLSAGLWYVAIDFQLFALFTLLLWLARYAGGAPLLVAAVAGLSLFWANRHPELDNWALYFFGSYGLGAAAWWASGHRHAAAWLALLAAVTLGALLVDFRLRIALALAVALLLGASRCSGLLEKWPKSAVVGFLGRISYSVFLVHFPIYLVANALFAHFGPGTPAITVFSLCAAWTASIAVATFFHRWVEGPAASRRIAGALGRLFSKPAA